MVFIYYGKLKVSKSLSQPDQTLEILMTDLDEQAMLPFHQENKNVGFELNLHTIVPETLHHDDFSFNPCGYSSNSILQQTGGYCTMHVTPEATHSFVSFETNSANHDLQSVIDRVVEVFKPGKYSVTLIANRESPVRSLIDNWMLRDDGLEDSGYGDDVVNSRCSLLKDKQVCCLDGDYKLIYKYFVAN